MVSSEIYEKRTKWSDSFARPAQLLVQLFRTLHSFVEVYLGEACTKKQDQMGRLKAEKEGGRTVRELLSDRSALAVRPSHLHSCIGLVGDP